jgi:hypothetical protein
MFDGLTEKLYVESKRMGKVALEAGMFAEHFEDQRGHLDRAYML